MTRAEKVREISERLLPFWVCFSRHLVPASMPNYREVVELVGSLSIPINRLLLRWRKRPSEWEGLPLMKRIPYWIWRKSMECPITGLKLI